jgi:hypothetical protein
MENAENSPGDDRRNDDPSAGAHGSDEGRSGGVGERVERMSGTAHDAWEAARQSVTDLRDRLDIGGRVERNPFGMVEAGVGVGYVLGGIICNKR